MIQPRELLHVCDVLQVGLDARAIVGVELGQLFAVQRLVVQIALRVVRRENRARASAASSSGRKVLKLMSVGFSDASSFVCSASMAAMRCSQSAARGNARFSLLTIFSRASAFVLILSQAAQRA